jgi:hypothetical protein
MKFLIKLFWIVLLGMGYQLTNAQTIIGNDSLALSTKITTSLNYKKDTCSQLIGRVTKTDTCVFLDIKINIENNSTKTLYICYDSFHKKVTRSEKLLLIDCIGYAIFPMPYLRNDTAFYDLSYFHFEGYNCFGGEPLTPYEFLEIKPKTEKEILYKEKLLNNRFKKKMFIKFFLFNSLTEIQKRNVARFDISKSILSGKCFGFIQFFNFLEKQPQKVYLKEEELYKNVCFPIYQECEELKNIIRNKK